jgi:transposase
MDPFAASEGEMEGAMSHLFWLSDEAWAVIDPHLPKNQPGARRVDDRRVISGILHVLKTGCRWRDCPAEYGPHTTIYNRFNRWSARLIWQRIFAALVESGRIEATASIDATYVKAHRSAHGGKGGRRRRPSASRAAGARPRSTSSPTSSAARPSSG